jgi:hypothetical protein
VYPFLGIVEFLNLTHHDYSLPRLSMPLVPPPNMADGSPISVTLDSACTGIGKDANGNFTHFIYAPNDLHKDYGYWEFTSNADERRAYLEGFKTPEELLRVVDYEIGTYENISLRWVPGRIGPVFIGPTEGNAPYHLIAIYHIKKFLGGPLSFRDFPPRYPEGPRMQEYWESRIIRESTTSQESANPSSTAPQASMNLSSADLQEPANLVSTELQEPVDLAPTTPQESATLSNPESSLRSTSLPCPVSEAPAGLQSAQYDNPLSHSDETIGPADPSIATSSAEPSQIQLYDMIAGTFPSLDFRPSPAPTPLS